MDLQDMRQVAGTWQDILAGLRSEGAQKPQMFQGGYKLLPDLRPDPISSSQQSSLSGKLAFCKRLLRSFGGIPPCPRMPDVFHIGIEQPLIWTL